MAGILKVDKYQDFNGNDIMTSDGSGNLTLNNAAMKATPAFSAYMGSDQNSIPDVTWTKVNMDTEFFDSDGKYDTSNYRFTPTVAGKYMFGASLYYNSGSTMETTEIAFYKNGTKLLYASNDVNNDNKQQLTGVIDLDSDDYVELYAYVNVASGGTFNVNQDGTTSNNRCYWYGYKIIGA